MIGGLPKMMIKPDDKYMSEDAQIYLELSQSIKYQIQQLDSLDIYTKSHIHSVPVITKRLCSKLSCSEEYTKFCICNAYLHDIGKLFVPPEILQKRESLTQEEYRIMKMHTIYGYNFCISIPELRKFAKTARSHHENKNGTGYPDRLIGNQISLTVDMIKISDIYDALTAKRQYKEAYSREKALSIIYKEVMEAGLSIKIFKALLDIIIEDIKSDIKNNDSNIKEQLLDEISNINKMKKAII